jgi:transglutaminase-like putative cysteine protease
VTGVSLRDPAIPQSPGTEPVSRQGGRPGQPTEGSVRDSTPAGTRTAVELGFFAALGGLGVLRWSQLVADPPLGRLLAALAIVTAGAAMVATLGARRPRWSRLAAVVTIVLATAAATVVVGLPARMLAPGGWAELADNLGRGLAGIGEVEMPYDGGAVWVRLALLLFAPLLLGLAALLGFWPSHRRFAFRLAGLAALASLYGVAVTLDSPGNELLWGIPLLALIAGWLWGPTLERGRVAAAVAVAAAAGVVALPLAARIDPASAWWDYRSWEWFGGESGVSFEWDHSYGPLSWPDDGTTLLDVRSANPAYWKASVLDRFDGFTWQRAAPADPLATAERAARRDTPGAELPERHREWLSQATFEVRALSSGVVIGAGTPQVVEGLADVSVSADGTLRAADRLRAEDEYSVLSYVPRPTATELRAAPATYPQERFGRSTLLALPARVGPTGEFSFAPDRARAMPLWGEPPDPELRAELLASPYGATYRLARDLVSGASTPYEATRAIERHLRNGYDYSPNVPEDAYPLPAFLFEDRAGYCQQFAGAMGLMLRMVGVPSRVVSGFAPGSLDQDQGTYEVRDTDAHSWVEVYFRGIGWVTFDPTPAAAPAASQGSGTGFGGVFRGRGSVADEEGGPGPSLEPELTGGELAPTQSEGGPGGAVVLAALAAVAALTGFVSVAIRRRRRELEAGSLAERQLTELRGALARLGWSLPGTTTLADLERRFRAERPDVARYAAALRAHRFAPDPPRAPGATARRALRRALSRGDLRRRWRGWLAIPPGGPR